MTGTKYFKSNQEVFLFHFKLKPLIEFHIMQQNSLQTTPYDFSGTGKWNAIAGGGVRRKQVASDDRLWVTPDLRHSRDDRSVQDPDEGVRAGQEVQEAGVGVE